MVSVLMLNLGAGKSTTFKIITAEIPKSSGKVILKNEEIVNCKITL